MINISNAKKGLTGEGGGGSQHVLAHRNTPSTFPMSLNNLLFLALLDIFFSKYEIDIAEKIDFLLLLIFKFQTHRLA